MSIPQFSPALTHGNLDPNLINQMQGTNMQQMQNPGQAAQLPQRMRGSQSGMVGSPLQAGLLPPNMQQYPGGQQQQNMWAGFEAIPVDGQSPSDSWSNASAQGPAVPTTLNVEDWYEPYPKFIFLN